MREIEKSEITKPTIAVTAAIPSVGVAPSAWNSAPPTNDERIDETTVTRVKHDWAFTRSQGRTIWSAKETVEVMKRP